ncbi:MAG: hypothetical protein LBN39_12750, partial [Planctomycetaceae bacterium]|nr:hypothetical protein [Planctomycetaceae bacterium]
MLYSMTGFGAASLNEDGITAAVELKTVNNRYFKLSLRLPDSFPVFETRIEPLLRTVIERGTVNAAVRIQKERSGSDYKICGNVLRSYYEQLFALSRSWGAEQVPALDRLVVLPGVIETTAERSEEETEKIWNITQRAVRKALD